MRGMPIERLYKPKNSFKVFRSDSYIPTGNNAVLDVICGNFLVRNGSVSVRTLKLIGLGDCLLYTSDAADD